MKYVLLFAFVCISIRAQQSEWASHHQIIQLAYALDVATFPIKYRNLEAQLPLPPREAFSGGASAREPEGTLATIEALTDYRSKTGFFALRTVVALPGGKYTNPVEFRECDVVSAELLFVLPGGVWLAPSSLSPHKGVIEVLRQRMKKEGSTPRAIVERWFAEAPRY